MVNYTYIIRTTSKEQFTSIYNQVILKYTFPMSLNITNVLTNEDKKNIISDEYNLVKRLITQITKRNSSTTNYNIILLPRIIYDLFFMMYYGVDNVETNITSHLFDIELDTYDKYCIRTNIYHEEISEKVYILNQYILEQLDRIDFDYSSPNYIEYEKIARYILNTMIMYSTEGANSQIISIYRNNFTNIKLIVDGSIHLIFTPKRIKSPTSFNVKSFVKILNNELKKIYPDSNILFFVSIIILSIIRDSLIDTLKRIYKIPNTTEEEKVQMAVHEFMIIFNDNERVEEILSKPEIYSSYPLSTFMNILDDDLILRCVKIESVESSNKQNKFVLYRGSNDAIEGAVYSHKIPGGVEDREGYSVSYNTSLFNGYFTDATACTYNFMSGDETEDKYKHYYSMRKFNYNDHSDVSNMFFIPPLHPFLQLSSNGEFWHPRSKIFIGSQIKGLGEFASVFDRREGIVGYSDLFPDYLISNLVNKRDTPSQIGEISARNKAYIKIKFNNYIKAHRYSIVPLSQNVIKKNTRKTRKTTRSSKSKSVDNDRYHHPESELFGGRVRTIKTLRRKRL